MAQQYEYSDGDIDQLLGAVRIRTKPASMLGSSGLSGARHGFTEIYGNALDEASSGFGKKLSVIYYKDGSMSLRDYGRGVPIGWNEKKDTWNWHIIYNDLYGGGKYNNNQELLQAITNWSLFNDKDYNYLYSVGLNGLGAASTQYTSEFFTVKSHRKGKCTEMNFESGIPIINGEKLDVFNEKYDMKSFVPNIYDTDEEDGTFIHWKPDTRVFTDINVGGDWLFSVCKDIAHVAHMDLHFENQQTGFVKDIEAGNLTSLAVENCGKNIVYDESDNAKVLECSNFGHGTTTVEGKPFIWICKLEAVLAYTKNKVETSCYHNSVRMGGGAQYEGVVTAIQKFFSGIGASKGVKLEYSDYENIFGVVVSSYSNYASFKGQTKDEVDNTFILHMVRDTILEKLNIEYGKGNPDILDAVDRVINEAQIRIAIREESKQIREAKKLNKQQKEPDKFHTCKAYMRKDYSVTELWITEGDSARGAVDKARNSDFQATFPIRGKCLNVLKSSIDKILANEEIKGIFNLIGTGMDIGHSDMFDIDKLRFDKIIFATDADEDGFQIRVLLFLVFYKLAPELLRSGHIYIAETPRFEIRMATGEIEYALTDAERDKIVEEKGNLVKGISRFKGLGEVNADVLRKTTVHPDTRHLVPLTMDFNDQNATDLIDALFGADKYKQRKSILTTVLGGDVADLIRENALLFDSIENSDIEDGIEYQTV